MKLGFVVDPLDHLKPYKDSSVAMMREAARRGHEIHAFEARELGVDALAGAVPLVVVVGNVEPANARAHHAVAHVHVARLQRMHLVPAARRLAHHRDGRILVRLEAFERVDDERELHALAAFASSAELAATSSSISMAAARLARRATTP